MANISDKEQGDIERAADDSAIRVQSFDGKEQQEGETKFVRASDNQPQGNEGSTVTDSVVKPGNSIGSHNDKPSVFYEPGKPNNRQPLITPSITALATATMKALTAAVVAGGSRYRDGDTINIEDGTFDTQVVVTPLTFAIESIEVNDGGVGYVQNTFGGITGGTFTSSASIRISEIGPATTQDETDYDGAGSNGTFAGGISHSVSDVITMSDGSTVRVDAIAEGVSQFTVLTGATTGTASNNPTLTQASTTGLGTGFSLTLGNANQTVVTCVVSTQAGNYSVLPANPVSASIEGTGSGMTLDIDWEILTASISVAGDYSVLPTDPVEQESTSGSGGGATFNIDWGVLAITVTNGGTGYGSVPAVTVTGGAGATATASVSGGTVSNIAVGDVGSGFSAVATVTVASP